MFPLTFLLFILFIVCIGSETREKEKILLFVHTNLSAWIVIVIVFIQLFFSSLPFSLSSRI